MPLAAKATPGVSVVFKIYQGEFQIGDNIPATESNSRAGYYTAPYPSLAAGEYELEGTAGSDELIPTPFYWDGAAEITPLTTILEIRGIDTSGSGGSGGLTTAQDETLTEILANTAISRQGAVGRYLVNESANTATLYEDDNATPVKVFDLKDRNGVPSTDEVFERVPR